MRCEIGDASISECGLWIRVVRLFVQDVLLMHTVGPWPRSRVHMFELFDVLALEAFL